MMKLSKILILFFLFFFVSYPFLSDWYSVPVYPKTSDQVSPDEDQAASPKKRESILFVGDIMLGRNVETFTSLFSTAYIFEGVRDLLFAHTYVIGNLEGPLPERHIKTPSMGFGFSFPSYSAEALSLYHFSALSLANNHTLDQGEVGYTDTVSSLLKNMIAPFGHSSLYDGKVVRHEIQNVTIATTGINLITPYFNEEDTLLTLGAVCEKNKDAALIAFIHAGTEYQDIQDERVVTFVHKLIDTTCVRAVIGSHPHVVQGIEKYKGKFIIYSLGNFVFDQYFSKETQEGLALGLTVYDDKLAFNLLPIAQRNSVPWLATGIKKDEILGRIASSSAESLRDDIKLGFLME